MSDIFVQEVNGVRVQLPIESHEFYAKGHNEGLYSGSLQTRAKCIMSLLELKNQTKNTDELMLYDKVISKIKEINLLGKPRLGVIW